MEANPMGAMKSCPGGRVVAVLVGVYVVDGRLTARVLTRREAGHLDAVDWARYHESRAVRRGAVAAGTVYVPVGDVLADDVIVQMVLIGLADRVPDECPRPEFPPPLVAGRMPALEKTGSRWNCPEGGDPCTHGEGP